MGQKVQYDSNYGTVKFKCPGCGQLHILNVDKEPRPKWGWNRSETRPTLTPSINAWREYGDKREKQVCHSFVEEGRIRFLNDCTHKLKGQTVDLDDIPS